MKWLIIICLAAGLIFADTEVEQPNADTLDGSWTEPDGGGDLFEAINEGSGSPDGTRIQCPDNTNSTCEVKISDPSGTGTCTAVQVDVYAKKSANGGNTRGLDGDIRINGSLEGSLTFSADLTSSYASYKQEWTSLSYDMATEMNTLNVELTSTGTTGGTAGQRRAVDVDYVEITITYSTGEATLYHYFHEY